MKILKFPQKLIIINKIHLFLAQINILKETLILIDRLYLLIHLVLHSNLILQVYIYIYTNIISQENNTSNKIIYYKTIYQKKMNARNKKNNTKVIL